MLLFLSEKLITLSQLTSSLFNSCFACFEAEAKTLINLFPRDTSNLSCRSASQKYLIGANIIEVKNISKNGCVSLSFAGRCLQRTRESKNVDPFNLHSRIDILIWNDLFLIISSRAIFQCRVDIFYWCPFNPSKLSKNVLDGPDCSSRKKISSLKILLNGQNIMNGHQLVSTHYWKFSHLFTYYMAIRRI